MFHELNNATLIEAALAYARTGWRVFPCAAGSKLPRKGSRGFLDATTDEAVIRSWWESAPHLNIGLAAGAESGVFVLDIDGEPGADWLIDQAERDRLLPDTLCQRTGGRGGRQYFFRMPAGISVGSNAGVVAEGVDLRGEGGYVVVPPSKITGGGTYTWLEEQPVAEAPRWLLDAIAGPGATSPQVGCDPMTFEVDGETLATAPGYATGQGRNPRLAQLVGRAFAAGLPLDTIRTQARAFGARCTPPLPPRECDKTVDSIAKRELDRLRGVTPVQVDGGGEDDDYTPAIIALPQTGIPSEGWRAFPHESTLPDCVARWISELSRRSSTDPATIAIPILSAMAGAIGNSRAIALTEEWREPAVLWTAIVADSGMKKSVGHEKAVQFVQAIDKSLEDDNKRDRERFERESRIHEAMLAQWKQAHRSKDGTSEPPPVSPAPPTDRALTIDDTTPEAVAKLLHDNPRGILLQKDELSSWLAGFDRYSGGGGAVSSEAAKWLSMHNAKPLKVDRRGAGRLRVDRAAVSICGCVTPEIMVRAVGTEHIHSGMLQRFLLAAPPKQLMLWPKDPMPAGLEAPVRRMFEALFELPLPMDGPAAVPLSREAAPVWVDHYNALAHQRYAATGPVASMLAKSEAAAARLALVIHQGRLASGESIPRGEIDADSLRRGITLARWFADEWRRIHGSTVGRPAADPAAEDLLRIVREAGGAIADREVRNRRKRFRDATERSRVISLLVSAGRLETFTGGGDDRGRPSLWLRFPPMSPVSDVQKSENAERGAFLDIGHRGHGPEEPAGSAEQATTPARIRKVF